MPILHTALYACLLGGMLIWLASEVIGTRRKLQTALGDAGDLRLQRRIRAHANFVEYTPLFLILLGIAEYQGLWAWAVHILGVVFMLGRLMHAHSLLAAEVYADGQIQSLPVWRIRGMICTFNCIGLLCLTIMLQYAAAVTGFTL